LGEQFYSLVQFRADRGFDPGSKLNGDARFDEYLLRWTPWADGRLNVQAGKFATVFGKWVQRHDSWQNPFVTAPLAYENVTVITDQVAPGTPAAFLGRRSIAGTFTCFVETKYKLPPNLFAAVRSNQQLFDTVPDGAGGTALGAEHLPRGHRAGLALHAPYATQAAIQPFARKRAGSTG
jgi:hypothetical protein